MACRELNGFNCRVANKPGVSKVHIFLFDVISQYVYENDDLNHVVGYSATVLPTSYKPSPEGSSYSGSRKDENISLFLHQLVLSFPKMEKAKRSEFEKLRNLELTIIFEDENGLSWIIGQHHPCKLADFSLQSGARAGSNDYTATFQSIEPYQIREIQGVSEGCFTSFSGSEQRRSVLTIINSDALDLVDFALAADDRVVNYTASPALQPALWDSNPVVFADNTAQLLNLFEAGGTVLALTCSYSTDAGGTVTITVDSNDTSFGGLIVDDVIQAPSAIGIILNLTTILSPEIANIGTIIQVSDSDGVLFSGGYGTAISGPGLYGTTNNAYIFVSFLYATTTTFTATVIDLPCSSVAYEYVFENTLTPCTLTTAFDFYKGRLLKVFVPYVLFEDAEMTGTNCPPFQNISINILGYIFNMYYNRSEWHSAFGYFCNDFRVLVSSIISPIDPASLIFTDVGTGVTIAFRLSGVNMETEPIYCNAFVRGLDQLYTENTQFLQSRVLNLQSFAVPSAIVTHIDDFSNEISGENGVNITTNDTFLLENTPYSDNTQIDNLGFLWAFDSDVPYSETSGMTTTAKSNTCFAPVIEGNFPKCYDSFVSETQSYLLFATLQVTSVLPEAGSTFLIETSAGNYTISLPITLTPTAGTHFATSLFNSLKDIQVLHYNFDSTNLMYIFHLRVKNTLGVTAITDLDNSRPFIVSVTSNVYSNTLTSKINPYCTLDWSLPSTLMNSPTGAKNLTLGEWQEQKDETSLARVIFDLALDTITVLMDYFNQTITFEVYPTINYPTTHATNAIWAEIPEGDTTLTIPSVAATLGTLADFGFIVITNQWGWSYVKRVDFTADFDITIKEFTRQPIIWGTMDTIEYLGEEPTTTPPTFGSLLCGA